MEDCGIVIVDKGRDLLCDERPATAQPANRLRKSTLPRPHEDPGPHLRDCPSKAMLRNGNPGVL